MKDYEAAAFERVSNEVAAWFPEHCHGSVLTVGL